MTFKTRLLSVKMIAERCGVDERTVRTWIDEGRLVAYRLGANTIRISEENYQQFLSERSTENLHLK